MKTKTTFPRTRFRLLEGQHHEPVPGFDGDVLHPDRLRKFVKGEIIEADRDLEIAFPNKFRRLSEEECAPPIDVEARRILVDQMISGGTWKEDDRRFLSTLSDENFKRLGNRFTEAVTSKSSEDRTMSTLGDDVTSLFQRAYDEGFKVFKNVRGKFQVTKKGDVNKPVNKEPLNQADVDKFVESYLKEK